MILTADKAGKPITCTTRELYEWYKDLKNWETSQVSRFFYDDDTGRVVALCCGPDAGSVVYERAFN